MLVSCFPPLSKRSKNSRCVSGGDSLMDFELSFILLSCAEWQSLCSGGWLSGGGGRDGVRLPVGRARRRGTRLRLLALSVTVAGTAADGS